MIPPLIETTATFDALAADHPMRVVLAECIMLLTAFPPEVGCSRRIEIGAERWPDTEANLEHFIRMEMIRRSPNRYSGLQWGGNIRKFMADSGADVTVLVVKNRGGRIGLTRMRRRIAHAGLQFIDERDNYVNETLA